MLFGWTKTGVALAMAAALAACGGSGGSPVAEAVVTAVSAPVVLEADAGTSDLLFNITLNKAALNAVQVTYSTVSTAKAGGGGTGSATGGATCGAGVDYVTASSQVLTIAAGASAGTIRVTLCGDTVFEPTETVNLSWSQTFPGTGAVLASGVATGTILNNDAGGLNGTGVAGSFGRDSQPLTNDATDGRLGFSFANVANAAAAGGNCVRDKVTGLLWEPKTGVALHDPAATFAWAGLAAHVALVKAANTCGFNDWRLPTPEELASLADSGRTPAPTTDTTWLTNTAANRYWTGTEYRDGTAFNAWYVDFNTGTVGSDDNTLAFRTRLVSRGGTTAPAPVAASCADATRYTPHGDGTVTDGRTGLMWKSCAEGQSGGTCSGAAVAIDWTAAVALPADVNSAAVGTSLGYTDWRLPTRAELSSITEREQCNNTVGAVPSVIGSVFPNTGLVDYWTATPDVFNAAQAWRVSFFDGEVAPAVKTGAFSSTKRVRLVRAGQ